MNFENGLPLVKEKISIDDSNKLDAITSSSIDFESIDRKNLENEKNWIFNHLIEAKLYDSFINCMKKYEYTQDEITEFDKCAKNLSEEEYKALVALPYELKEIGFPYVLKMIREGKMTISQYVNKIVEKNLEQGRIIAYHASDKEVRPFINKDNKKEEWVVNGTEKDHRDDDLPMAYYSFDYANLYRKKNPNHIYAVSILTKGKTGNKKDFTGDWGRAPSLTVIEHFNMKEIDKEVAEEMKKISESRNKKEG